MLDQEEPPPFSSLFGEVDDGSDCENCESAGDAWCALDAESPRAQPQLEPIDETVP